MEELKPTHSMPAQSESASWTIPLSINWKQPKVVLHWGLRCNSFELLTSSDLTKCKKKKTTDRSTPTSLLVAQRQENCVIKPGVSTCATDQAVKEFSALKKTSSIHSCQSFCTMLDKSFKWHYCRQLLCGISSTGHNFYCTSVFSFVIKEPQGAEIIIHSSTALSTSCSSTVCYTIQLGRKKRIFFFSQM